MVNSMQYFAFGMLKKKNNDNNRKPFDIRLVSLEKLFFESAEPIGHIH